MLSGREDTFETTCCAARDGHAPGTGLEVTQRSSTRHHQVQRPAVNVDVSIRNVGTLNGLVVVASPSGATRCEAECLFNGTYSQVCLGLPPGRRQSDGR